VPNRTTVVSWVHAQGKESEKTNQNNGVMYFFVKNYRGNFFNKFTECGALET
jgi:hypothetical protein